MAKNRRSSKSTQALPRSQNVVASPSATSSPPVPNGASDLLLHSKPSTPSLGIIRLLSLAIIFHFAAILLALASNYAPSYLQGMVLDYLSPYLVTTHQAYGAMPLELTHGSSIDFPVEIQVQRGDASKWDKLELWKVDKEEKRSRWHSFERITTIVSEDEPESEILSEIANQIVEHAEAATTRKMSEITAVRLVQPHVMSFEEDLVFASGGESFIEAALTTETLFAAKVVRSDGRVIGVLPVQEDSRTAQALKRAEPQE